MNEEDLAEDALRLLAPRLAPGAEGSAERVDNGRNSNHPGQTFDFALTRQNGERIALEVTRAWPEKFMQSFKPWVQLTDNAERLLAGSATGRYVVGVTPAVAKRARDHRVEELVEAIARCASTGPGASIELSAGVKVGNRTQADDGQLRIYVANDAVEAELGPEPRERFAEAIARKVGRMTTAGAAGYETHLAVVLWALGSAASCRQYIADNPPTFEHPQHIWIVDLNVSAGTQGRKPVELVYGPGRGRIAAAAM